MNELPREARAMLALAKDAHDPPDASARERVRTKVLAAVAIAPVGLSVGAAQLAKPSTGLFKAWFGSKSGLAGALLLLAAGGGFATLRVRPDATARAPAFAQHAAIHETAPGVGQAVAIELAPAPEPAAAPETAPPLNRARAPRPVAKRTSSPTPSLRAEVSLLTRATEQLEQGDAQAALRSLQEHRRRFAHTQLQPEREGLEVLAHCQQKQPQAQAAARSYLARTPASMLVARIEQTCAL